MAGNVYDISLVGMNIQRTIIVNASENIANMNSISASAESVYKTKSLADINRLGFAELLNVNRGDLTEISSNYKKVFKPEHELADSNGFIYMPDINVAKEMLNLNTALRAYEANVKAFNVYKSMSAKALEIGK